MLRLEVAPKFEKSCVNRCLAMSNQIDLAKIQTVIAARPGAIRQAMKSTLALFPRLEISGVADGGLSALSLIRRQKPALIVIDSGLLEGEITMLLQKIKQEQLPIYCLAFADTIRQREAFLTLGADGVILHSEPTERLVEMLEKITL